MMNSPQAEKVRQSNQETIERSRRLSEYCRNVDRLIRHNNRRIARGLRPFEFPPALIEAGEDLAPIPAATPELQEIDELRGVCSWASGRLLEAGRTEDADRILERLYRQEES